MDDALNPTLTIAITAVNVVLSLVLLLIAAYASHGLLSRDDARRWRARRSADRLSSSGEVSPRPFIGAFAPLPPAPPETERSVFLDDKSVLFMAAAACALGQSATLFALTLPDPKRLHVGDGRPLQDLLTAPQAQLFLLYFLLLAAFVWRLDAAPRRGAVLWGSLAALSGGMAVAVALVAGGVWPNALEVFGAVCEGVLALGFAAAAGIVPRRIARYGESLAPVATRVRRVAVITALALTGRMVLLLPIVQSKLAVAGLFATSIFFCFSAIPVAASLHLLHSKIDKPRNVDSSYTYE